MNMFSITNQQPGTDAGDNLPVNLALTHGKTAIAIALTDLLGTQQVAIQLTVGQARDLAQKLGEFADTIGG